MPEKELPSGHWSLAGIEATLPPHKPLRDRVLRFEENGAIVYKQEEDDDPPNDINGYLRDPNNLYRFVPLWLPCQLRFQTGYRIAKCGCINIIMRCNNPQLPSFADRVSHDTCHSCLARKPWET
jgi:hypothetical protein